MRRKLPAMLGAGLMVMVAPTLAQAAPSPDASRFQTTEATAKLASEFKPGAANPDATVHVIVELKADPVAVVESKRGTLTKAQKTQLRSSLKASQSAVVKAVQAKGGKVESQMQSAINGVKVKIARKDVAALAALPEVKAVHTVKTYTLDNAVSVPYLGAPEVWQSSGKTGKGVKVAILDTGIDYTHADFGGPGTKAAYEEAHATETDEADPSLFGPNAPRIKGGIDLVGDDYDANDPNSVPVPDPNPLDCQGHGSHVAGTTAGGGVTADGKTYTGPYNSSTSKKAWTIGPGVAPQADLYAVRVFGCGGSTNVVTEAIDWAVANDMDVINMSLGSSFGRGDDADSIASSNAAAAGVVVVASAGNSGPNPYIVGSPSAGAGVISVAATDSTSTFPGVKLSVAGKTLSAINANGATIPAGSFNVVIVKDDPATAVNETEGCTPEAFTKSGVSADASAPTQVAVIVRGTCARVSKAIYGQDAGADAVIMVNNSEDLPPYEGPITENADTGDPANVTIPFLGVKKSDGPTLTAADSQALTMVAAQIDNPGYRKAASFTSGGAVSGSSALKPSVSAPGVSIQSAGVGSGNGYATMSGTSMAAPHVAGVAALAVEAHPTWSGQEISSALVSTADKSKLDDYRLTLEGNGQVDIKQLVNTSVFATGDAYSVNGKTANEPSLSFGFAEFSKTWSQTKTVTLTNKGKTPRTFTLKNEATKQSKAATVTFSKKAVTVPAGSSATVNVTLSVKASDIPSSLTSAFSFWEVSGQVVATSGSDALAVPYLLVPRSTSDVSATATSKVTSTTTNIGVSVKNSGTVYGSADFYTLGLTDKEGDVTDSLYSGGLDLRAAGVQSFVDGNDQLMVFAVNSWSRYSNAASNEYDVVIDTNRNGKPDVIVFSADSGLVRAGDVNGQSEVFIYDLATGALGSTGFYAQAPTDSSTVLLPVYASDLGLTKGSGSFKYSVQSYSVIDSTSDGIAGSAEYNPWKKGLEDGQWSDLEAGVTEQVPVAVNRGFFNATKPAGLMVVSYDNKAGANEAVLVPVK